MRVPTADPVEATSHASAPAPGLGMPAPLDYRPLLVDGMSLLARDPAGQGRIVEVLGDLDRAHAVAVVVPGNAHRLDTYLTHTGAASPRANGLALYATLREVAPDVPGAVVVWLGYTTPVGLVQGARREAAVAGAGDLARLTHHLPVHARITLVGHSYGSLVCALAAEQGGRVDDLVALASPGLGVRDATELRTTARVWTARAERDWVRFLPRGRIGQIGHGRQPTDPRYGATAFATDGAVGHSSYYTPHGEAIHNIARITTGLHHLVTRAGRSPGSA